MDHLNSLRSSVKQYMERLVAPAQALTDMTDRCHARLLATLLLLMMAQSAGAALLGWHQLAGFPYIDVLAFTMLLVSYLLVRTAYYRLSVWMSIWVISLWVLSLSLYHIEQDGSMMLSSFIWLTVPILLAYLLLPSRRIVDVTLLALSVPLVLLTIRSSSSILHPIAALGVLGSLTYTAGRQRDSDRYQIAQQTAELVTSQNRYQIMSELVSDYTVALEIQPGGHPQLQWKMGPDQIFGHEPASFFTNLRDYIYPDDLARVQQSYQSVRETGQDEAEFRVKGHDGSLHWVRARSRQAPNGWIYSAITDVTPYRQAEETLRRQEHQFRALVEHTPDLIARFDRCYRHLYVNPALERFSGMALDQYVGKTSTELGWSEADFRPWLTAFDTVFDTGEETVIEVPITTPKGERYVLETRVVPERDEQGVIQTVLAITRNVTERRQAEQQRLEQARQQERVQVLERFMREAAHDLITPLTTMKTNLYLMRRTNDHPKIQRRIELLEDETSHIEASINALLKMTRMNEETFEFAPANLNLLVEQVVAAQRQHAEQMNIPLTFEPGTNIPAVMLDSSEFPFVIQELLTNAVAHSTSQQPITVQTAVAETDVCISVIDHGEGIKDEDLNLIFEPFYRSPAREVSKGGIGLGLTIAKWIVQAHHGRIEVESQVGKGSSFHVYLPLVRQRAEPQLDLDYLDENGLDADTHIPGAY